jgi:biotin carboxyl carrier protein
MIHRFSIELPAAEAAEREVTIERLDGGRFRFTHAGRTVVYDARRVANGGGRTTWSLVPEGGGATALVDVEGQSPDVTVSLRGLSVPIKIIDARRKAAANLGAPPDEGGPVSVKSPMPGKVVKVLCSAGQAVKAGQGVVVVEAMKMENELKAPRDGTVKALAVKEGQPVDAGQALVTLE